MIQPEEVFYGVYIVNSQGEETRLRGHTVITELMRTVETERMRLSTRPGLRVVTYREIWNGNTLVSKTPWAM